jgi:hypothetical protein
MAIRSAAASPFCRPEEDRLLLLDRASRSIAHCLARIDAIDSALSAAGEELYSRVRWRSSVLMQAAISAACIISFPRQVHLTVRVYRAHLSVRQSLEDKGWVAPGKFSIRRWRKDYASGYATLSCWGWPADSPKLLTARQHNQIAGGSG